MRGIRLAIFCFFILGFTEFCVGDVDTALDNLVKCEEKQKNTNDNVNVELMIDGYQMPASNATQSLTSFPGLEVIFSDNGDCIVNYKNVTPEVVEILGDYIPPEALPLFFDGDIGVMSQGDPPSTESPAWYLLGLNYQQEGKYGRAAIAFKNSLQTNPKHKYADYCLFSVGRCYEKLIKQKLISESDAKAVIASTYKRLLQTYPDSKGATYAHKWLERNVK